MTIASLEKWKEAVSEYLNTLRGDIGRGIYTEHTHRPTLKTLLESVLLLKLLGGTGERLDWYKQTKDRLKKVSGVKEVYGVLGRFDLVAMVEAESLEDLTTLVADKIRSVPGVQTSETLTLAF